MILFGYRTGRPAYRYGFTSGDLSSSSKFRLKWKGVRKYIVSTYLRKGARNTKEEKMYWLHLLWCKNFQQPPKQHQRNPKHKHFQISSEGLDMGGDPILMTNVYYSNYIYFFITYQLR